MSEGEFHVDTPEFALVVRASNGLSLAKKAVERDEGAIALINRARSERRVAAELLVAAFQLIFGFRRVRDLDAALFGYLAVLNSASPELVPILVLPVLARRAGHWSTRLAQDLGRETLPDEERDAPHVMYSTAATMSISSETLEDHRYIAGRAVSDSNRARESMPLNVGDFPMRYVA
jgi:hypothetical protein